jgi:hypothetical protein
MASGSKTRWLNVEETATMYRRTVAEIDLATIRDNLRAIQACAPLKTQVIGVVKADAYGHGAARVAAVLEQEQVRLLAMATTDEAVEVRKSGIAAELLVLGKSPADFVSYAVTNNVTLTTANQATRQCTERRRAHIRYACTTRSTPAWGARASWQTMRQSRSCAVLRSRASTSSASIHTSRAPNPTRSSRRCRQHGLRQS